MALIKTLTYWCEGIPTKDDIKEAIEIANKKNVKVLIKYFFYYNYTWVISPGDDFDRVWEGRINTYSL